MTVARTGIDWFIHRITPEFTSSAEVNRSWLNVTYSLVLHLFLSVHNGWIDPILANYRRVYNAED